MTPEGRVKYAISALLRRIMDDRTWYYMPVASGFGRSSLDYLGVVHGKPFAIEAKAPKGRLTSRQLLTVETMVKAGIKVFVINGPEGMTELEAWLSDAVKS